MDQGGDSAASAVNGSRLRRILLIVEADLWTRYSAAEYFRARGFRVLEAKCADEAISLLTAGKPVDLVFSDTNASAAAGTLCLADWIAQQFPTLPVLLTGTDSRNACSPQLAVWPRGFIAKPYLLADVERQIVGFI